jgi:hypothetical protein
MTIAFVQGGESIYPLLRGAPCNPCAFGRFLLWLDDCRFFFLWLGCLRFGAFFRGLKVIAKPQLPLALVDDVLRHFRRDLSRLAL